MASVIIRSIFFIIFTLHVFCDEIEMEVQSNVILKMLREMVKQTAAEALNLPANASSIRENITDTFSCENYTYGYYADVDNECQIFHICLPSQTPSGRNVTYKWSFICPQETVFNQEVLVCTRPRDSIPCDESPNFYDLNMEIGKIAPDTSNDVETVPKKETERIPVKKQNQYPSRRKQNLIMEALMKDAEEKIETIEEILNEKPIELDVEPEAVLETNDYRPEVTAVNEEYAENDRLGLERNVKRSGRKMWRGSMRFKSDA